MNDNTTAHLSAEYDDQISATIPFYSDFHESAIDLVRSINKMPDKWLDTGCGTGIFYMNARNVFVNTEFILADPSEQMLEIAKEKAGSGKSIIFVPSDTQSITYNEGYFDVITAIQCHHYLDRISRMRAVENCFRMLKTDGIFVTFENIMPLSEYGRKTGLERWKRYQIRMGKTADEAQKHMDRFGKEYFPIPIPEHINLLKETGFRGVEVLWTSYMQAGFYAIKRG